MKKTAKMLAAAGCALALMAGAAAASSAITTRTLEAHYAGIKLVVSGQAVSPKDAYGNAIDPFIVDGTVYLPLRAVGEALGKSVEWDGETYTVYVGKAPMEEDAQQLVDIVEQTHPSFALNAVPAGYEAAKQALLEQAQDPACTLVDLAWAGMAYMASLQDAHTRLDPFGGVPQAMLDIGWVADGEHLYLTGQDAAVTATEVTAVGGVSTTALFAAIDKYVASENQAGRDVNHAKWAAVPALLRKVGAVFSEEGTLVVSLKDGGAATTQTVGVAMPDGGRDAHVITTQKMGDVFYVDFNQCIDGDELQLAVTALREAVQSGTKKVIIDVRGNGGGNSDTCVQLLHAMGMEVPNYGVFIRYSPLAHGTYPEYVDTDSGSDRYDPHPETARANPEIQLVVLTDEDTFSSATMMGVYVRDGKLGTLIGRPSSNMPNSYGDILLFGLNHSRIDCTVSYKQFLRPDQSALGNELKPDIVTAVGEDALQTALNYLEQK